jgi:ribosomal protein S6E (S10)
MRRDVEGGMRKGVLVSPGVGFKGHRLIHKKGKRYRWTYAGVRMRRNFRGNTITQDTVQLNLKVVESGKKSLGVIFGLVEEAATVEEPSGEEE